MDVDDTEPPMEGPGGEPQLYCKPIGVDADDASDGDGADASDAGEPRLLESSHRAISDGLGGGLCGQHGPADAVLLRLRGDLLDRAERFDIDGSYRYRFTGASAGVLRFIN